MSGPRHLKRSAYVVMLAVVAALPLVSSNQYDLGIFTTMFIVITLNASWNLLLGIAGVWNFGQLAIYAAGGYGAGLLMVHTSLPAWLAVIGGGLSGGVVAILIAIPTMRLFGIYTSLLTFAFAEVIQLTIQNDSSGLTGGAFGFPAVGGLYPSLSPLSSIRAYYWTTLAVAALAIVATAVITRSHFGLALRALRDSAPYAAARGVSPMHARVIAFAGSGFIAGIAGALYVSFNGSISPTVMGLTPMSISVAMLVIGGLGTVMGPAIGTAVVTAIQQALIGQPAVALTVLGSALLVIVVFAPHGLIGEWTLLLRRVGAWMDEGADDPEPQAHEATPPGIEHLSAHPAAPPKGPV